MSETSDNSAPDIDQQIAPFLPFIEHDLRPGTPHVVIELSLNDKLTEDSDCVVSAKIRRSRDDYEEPCVIYWNPEPFSFGPAAFLLFRHTASGLQKIDINNELSGMLEPPLMLEGFRYSVWELAAGRRAGEGLAFGATLAERYRREMVVGKYELVWPGVEIALWDWGTKKQHLGQELGPKSPKIWVPAARITLEVEEEEEVRRAGTPQIEPSERIPGAPVLSASMECEATVAQGSSILIKRSVVYEAPPGSSSITIHSFWLHWNTMLYRRKGDEWKKVEDDSCSWRIMDDPDIDVNVSQHEDFTSLEGGEAWTLSYTLDTTDMGDIPRGVAAGDVFRYRFMGVELDWWDWGGKKEHAETTVKVPCFIHGRVVDPEDNGGRPKLVVPASDFVEFTIV